MRFYRVVRFDCNDRTIQPQRPLDSAAMTAQYHGSLQTQKIQPLAGLKQMIFDFVTAKVKKFMTSRYICPNKPFRHEKDNHMLHPLRKGSSAGRNTGSLIGSSLHPPDISAGKTPATLQGNYARCQQLSVESPAGTDAMLQIASHTQTPYILLLTKEQGVELGYMALERFCDYLQAPSCGMAYADRYQWIAGKRTNHPVIDYQTGSVRDDFDFGPLLMFRSEHFKKLLTALPVSLPISIPDSTLCGWL